MKIEISHDGEWLGYPITLFSGETNEHIEPNAHPQTVTHVKGET